MLDFTQPDHVMAAAFQFVREHAARYDCGLRGDCHALLVVAPGNTFYDAMRALMRAGDGADDEIMVITRSEAVTALLDLHGIPSGDFAKTLAEVAESRAGTPVVVVLPGVVAVNVVPAPAVGSA